VSVSAFATLSLVVKPLSGKECITALGSIGKITYSGDSIYVYDAAKTIVFCDLLANVQHVRFSEERLTPTDLEDLQGNNATQVLVYPNPTQDLLHVKNVQADEVRLYTLTGSLMQTEPVKNGEVQLNVSSFPSGGYLLLCGNEAFQIIKK
jgi:hypothetical protein